MNRSSLPCLRIVLLSALTIFTSCKKSEAPNILFILVDDLGWTDLGYSGSTFYETPNIDELALESVQFTNAYSAGSVCSPTRASLMTGKHPVRVNITDWIPGQNPKGTALVGPQDLDELPLQEITIAEKLKAHGYHTFFAGKWHLGGESFLPEDQGFDENYGGHHMGSPPGGYYAPYMNPKLIDGPKGEYLTDRLTDESIHFLDRINNEPFFLYLSFYTVHTPIQASKRHIEYFNEKLSTLESPDLETRIDGNGRTSLNQVNADYASMVYAMDENVGRLIEAMKEKGLYDNTVIIFTSDNGGLSTLNKNSGRLGPTSVLPLRGGKGWLYEGGIRVPLLIKTINGKSGISKIPVISFDLFPTIMKMTGITDEIETDGIDLSDVLSGKSAIEERCLVWHYPHYHGSGWTPGAAIRKGDWKLIEFYESQHIELYNLAEDISESNDLSDEYPEKVKELKEMLHTRQKKMSANLPRPRNDKAKEN